MSRLPSTWVEKWWLTTYFVFLPYLRQYGRHIEELHQNGFPKRTKWIENNVIQILDAPDYYYHYYYSCMHFKSRQSIDNNHCLSSYLNYPVSPANGRYASINIIRDEVTPEEISEVILNPRKRDITPLSSAQNQVTSFHGHLLRILLVLTQT